MIPRPRRLLASVVIATLTGATPIAICQVPPEKNRETRPGSNSSVLDGIVTTMQSGLRSEREASVDVRAGNQLRNLVIELALQGRREGPATSTAAMAAIRLAGEIRDLETWLVKIVRGDLLVGNPPEPVEEAARSRILRRLEVFSDIALDEFRRRPRRTPSEIDDALAVVLAPIRDAIEVILGRELQTRWPTITNESATNDPPLQNLSIADARLQTITRSWLESEMPARFRETLAPRIKELTKAIVADSEDPDHRIDLDRLEVMIRLAADLFRADGSGDPDHTPFDAISRAVNTDCDPRERTDLARALKELLVPTNRIERMETSESSTELRAHRRRLQDRYERSLRSVPNDTDELDRRWIMQVAKLQNCAEDLRRAKTADRLLVDLAAVNASARPEIVTRLRTWLRMLSSPGTRVEAATALDRLEIDADRFLVLPGQQLLESPTEDFNLRIAGRATDLSRRIELARRGWVSEVSGGTFDGPSSGELTRLSRLLRILLQSRDFSAESRRVLEVIQISNQWGGWFIDSDSIAWSARALAPGLLIAADAAADGEAEELERDLDRLEHLVPPARLLIRVADAVESSLAGLPRGGIGAVATLVTPPGPDAWGLEHRSSFADICCGFAEISEARRQGEDQMARTLATWLAHACDDLLTELDGDDSNSISTESGTRPESGIKEQGT